MPTDLDLDLFGAVAVPPRSRRAGRRVFLPAALRAKAEEMRRGGASLSAIADALGISQATVRVRLKAELERGLPGGRPAGRPRWQPTAEDRAMVARLAAEGVTLGGIAEILGVTIPTIRRHCAADLARGRDLCAARHGRVGDE